jgi:diaminopimelate epimerase
METAALPPGADRPQFARDVCERHRGIGADGLMLFDPRPGGAAMRLLNADGSRSEVSGNGVRCLAAWLAAAQELTTGAVVEIDTEAGPKHLELLDVTAGRFTFRASMGQPEAIALESIDVDGERVDAVTLRVGNPQSVVLGEVSHDRLHRLASRLAVHPRFTEGTNVELATVVAPDHVRILIWERGVGPTEASGTGACAAAVASMQYGGAARDVRVESPGGTQRVEWRDEGVYLTGWAEVILEGQWVGGA